MNKPSIRLKVLVQSVQRLLLPDEQVHSVAVMFTRHRWFLPYSIFASIAIYLVSTTAVIGAGSRVLVALCGFAIAGLATTNYWVLADIGDEFVICRSSRVRQYAKAIVDRLPRDTELDMAGSTVITSDWRIDGTMYTATKRWESAIREMASAR